MTPSPKRPWRTRAPSLMPGAAGSGAGSRNRALRRRRPGGKPPIMGRDTWMRGRTSSSRSFGHLVDEARRRAEAVHAVQAALLGVADVQLLHRAGDAHVAQAALFLEAVEVVDGALVREESVFHAARGTPPGTPGPWRCAASSSARSLPIPGPGPRRIPAPHARGRLRAAAASRRRRRRLTVSASKPRAALTSSSRFSMRASPLSCLSLR